MGTAGGGRGAANSELAPNGGAPGVVGVLPADCIDGGGVGLVNELLLVAGDNCAFDSGGQPGGPVVVFGYARLDGGIGAAVDEYDDVDEAGEGIGCIGGPVLLY